MKKYVNLVLILFLSLASCANSNNLYEEFRIDINDKYTEYNPSIAMNNNGDFVATWSGWGSSKYGIYAKMFDANGNAKKNLDKNKLN